MTATDVDPRTVPGGLETHVKRELDDGTLIEFEFAPAGWLTKKGEPRVIDWRAYFIALPGGRRTRVPSVTTLLGAVCPKDLTRWGEEHGIRGAVVALRRGLITATSDEEYAVGQVRAAKLGADAARDRAADRGVNVHALGEHYMRTGEPPNPADHLPEHHGFIQAYTRWLLRHEPEPLEIEQLVADPAAGYAGRMDLRARIAGQLVTVDFKTNPRAALYAQGHVQAAMYEHAAVTCGADPADRIMLVVFAADGSFREMDCQASPETVAAALAWYRQIKPIDGACESANRVERQARKAAA